MTDMVYDPINLNRAKSCQFYTYDLYAIQTYGRQITVLWNETKT